MKTSRLVFTAGILSMFLLTNCRTGDDGTNNHGKATEGIKDRMSGDKDDTNSMETNVPAGDTSGIQM